MDAINLRILAAVLAILLGFGVADAGPGGPRGERLNFETLDFDGSGEIDAGDLEALRAARFAEIDADGDQMVTETEFVAHAERMAAERAAAMFSRLDADGDGVLSLDALAGRLGGRGMSGRFIERADTDGSGGVSAEEFDAFRAAIVSRLRDGGPGRKGGGHGWGMRAE